MKKEEDKKPAEKIVNETSAYNSEPVNKEKSEPKNLNNNSFNNNNNNNYNNNNKPASAPEQKAPQKKSSSFNFDMAELLKAAEEEAAKNPEE